MHQPALPPVTFGYVGQGQSPTPRPVSVVTESALFHAYKHSLRRCPCTPPEPEQCTCGDWIAPASIELIEMAVALHNETDRHQLWRLRRDRGNA